MLGVLSLFLQVSAARATDERQLISRGIRPLVLHARAPESGRDMDQRMRSVLDPRGEGTREARAGRGEAKAHTLAAFLAGAFFAGAFLAGAFLAGAFFAGAFLAALGLPSALAALGCKMVKGNGCTHGGHGDKVHVVTQPRPSH